MEIIEASSELRKAIIKARRTGQSIGFVPTMGYLHEGHLSLMRQARQDNDVVVASIFVNPAQFGPNEDLDAYPRDAARDRALMARENVDLAYFPSVEQLYPEGYATYVSVEGPMSQGLCGKSRPVHFRGVATIVTKLFHLVAPDRAYFGQKDAQQVAIIQRMVKDLNFDLEVVVCPTVREADGLAMSSRNAYLSPQHRADAVALSQSLFEARDMISKGERQAEAIRQHIESNIHAVPDAVIDYIAIVDALTLSDVSWLDGETLIALAVQLGGTRLIDNIRIRV
jgi:pantoate--beta-alanine ligase